MTEIERLRQRIEGLEERVNEIIRLLRNVVSGNDLSGTRAILEDDIKSLRNQLNDAEARIDALESNSTRGNNNIVW